MNITSHMNICEEKVKVYVYFFKGLASYCKAETTFTFYFTILPLSRAFLSINNREMKSESGFSFAMASQPLAEIDGVKVLAWNSGGVKILTNAMSATGI